MKSFNVNLENCHGINRLKNNFEFQKSNLILLYAPNGTMKTSFANTFKDLAEGIEPQNKVFENLKPLHTVKIDKEEVTAEDIKKRVFVIDTIDDNFNFEESAPLISNVEKRKEYSEIFNDINDLKTNFLVKVKNLAQIKGKLGSPENLEAQILKDFNQSADFLDFLDNLNLEVEVEDLSDFRYSDLFNDKVTRFLEDSDVQEDMGEFRDNLDELIKSSEIFNEDFNYTNANALLNAISKNNLFMANHSINFNSIKNPIENIDDLKELFDSEIGRIFNDDSIAIDGFKNFNKKFKNQETKAFQEIIRENPFLVKELEDVDKFRQNYWISIFKILQNEIGVLITEFDSKKETLKEIEKQAQEEETMWNKVIELFNSRFTVPFTLTIGNKEGVILKDSIPEIKFLYKQGDLEDEVSLEKLKDFCSRGQLRALYLLDIIYKIKLIEDIDDPKLLIMDDIADSFDYQNKYAIVEYINDLVKSDAFRIILLTHNYDFFRTLCSKFGDAYQLFAIKNDTEIRLDAQNSKKIGNNILGLFKKNLTNAINKNNEIKSYKYFISILPFIRNLYDYVKDQDEKNQLTYILHYKDEGKEKKIKDLEKICERWGVPIPPYDKLVYDAIEETADNISAKLTESKLNIENKIVLSIAIRIVAEKYMLKCLGIESTKEITQDQTSYLFDKYKDTFPEDENLDLFEKVNMMTPQNIHVNSFMYEPILDMDDTFLKRLYLDVKKLNSEV